MTASTRAPGIRIATLAALLTALVVWVWKGRNR